MLKTLTILALAIFATGLVACGDEAEDSSKEASSALQKDFDKKLEQLNDKIADLKKQIAGLSGDAKTKAEAALKDLEGQKGDLKDQFEKAKKAGMKALGDAKTGLSNAFDDAKKGLGN